ncbi:antitoxin Xre/MbcA/ParS toxin-binding domain-containing protein [Pseudoalteromonas lipolytica]|jgi:putative toxin-antitoxin system antitoxin component (TIGR02293 family)
MSKSTVQLDFLYVVTNGKLSKYSSPLEEINYVENGVNTEVLQAISKLLNWELDLVANIIGVKKSSLLRKSTKLLNKKASENAIEITKLSEFGLNYFENIDNWNHWLNTPHLNFEGQPPLRVIDKIRGRELIRDVIYGLKYGYTA